MINEKTKRVFFDTVKKMRPVLVLFIIMSAMNGAVFVLYDIIMEAFVYAEILATVLVAVIFVIEFFGEWKAAAAREDLMRGVLAGGSVMPDPRNSSEEDYQEIINELAGEIERLKSDFQTGKQEADEYYTTWVHQIKTPISVMKLRLAGGSGENGVLYTELLRIEQYVEMVLEYIRLESETTDLVIREYEADEIIREALRKSAPQFIQRKLRLVYEPSKEKVITDKKYLGFILDQLISNAVKYTPEGEIRISAGDKRIRIEDTGIGISQEDIPRIFDKGYTGLNGRLDKKSSGLGLFLCRKAGDLLAITITCESEVGKGTAFTLTFPEK